MASFSVRPRFLTESGGVFCAAVLLASTLGCGAAPAAPEPLVSVETAPAKIAPIAQVVTGEGVIFPIRQASLSPKISAPVLKYYVNRGDRVHRGELLAQLENRDLQAAVVSAQGSYDQAKAAYASATDAALPEELQKAQLDAEDARSSLHAQQQLYDSEQKLYQQGAIPRKQLDQSEVALTAARSADQTAAQHLKNLQATGVSEAQRAAKGQLEMVHGQYQAATAQLAYTELRSPIDGVIAERTVYPGDTAVAGTPLLVVMDTSKVVVRLHIPQSQAVQLKLGDPATLEVPGLETPVPAKVTVISPALDPNSTTVEVWVQADNSKGQLQSGTSVNISITARAVPNALVIPSSALLTGPNGATSVMIVGTGSAASSRPVRTGIEQGQSVQILSGLKAGDEVIVSGAFGLPDKTKVKATPAASTNLPSALLAKPAKLPDAQVGAES